MFRKSFTNPYLSGIDQVQAEDGKKSSFGGILLKTIYFLVLTGLGAAYAIFNPFPQYEVYVAIGATAALLISLLMVWFIRSTVPVAGSIYALAQGVLGGWASVRTANLYNGAVLIALIVTVAIFALLLILYSLGLIRVGNRFKSMSISLLFGSIMIYGIVYASSFFTTVLTDVFYGDGMLGLVISAAMVLIASFSLLVDFDNVSVALKNGLPKKYEWFASFGLVVSLVWLYLKILRFVGQIMAQKNKN